MYSKWLPSDTIEKIISISEESDVDIKESLEEFAEAIKSGEDVEIEDEVVGVFCTDSAQECDIAGVIQTDTAG